MALDEVTQICPVDLPLMLSDSAGKGVLITAVAHRMSQLEDRWGKHGADTIWAMLRDQGAARLASATRTRWSEASELCGTSGDGRRQDRRSSRRS